RCVQRIYQRLRINLDTTTNGSGTQRYGYERQRVVRVIDATRTEARLRRPAGRNSRRGRSSPVRSPEVLPSCAGHARACRLGGVRIVTNAPKGVTPHPRRSSSQKRARSHSWQIAMTQAEHAAATEKAAEAGLTPSSYGRAVILGTP